MDVLLAEPPARSHPALGANLDPQLVGFVGRHGVVTIDHVIGALELPRATAYRRAAACIQARLLERLELMHFEPSLLRATRTGLRFAGLSLPTTPVSPGQLGHRLRCASTAQLLAEEFGPERVITERELRHRERTDAKPIASARLECNRIHRPDLAVIADDGNVVAIEVELAPKGPKRLEPIIEAWKRASRISEIRYYCEPGPTRRGVERAVKKTDASDRIRILAAPARGS